MIKKILLVFVALIFLVPITLFFTLKISPLSWQLLGPINEDSGLAIKGYDVVAYLNDEKSTAGQTNKGLRYNDTIWYFSTDENKLTFKTFPEKYIPQYGGYCAKAVASGVTADINPDIWHIVNGKLYMFLNEDAKQEFIAQLDQGIIKQADDQWRKTYGRSD
jgi:YHS domain-containing protein